MSTAALELPLTRRDVERRPSLWRLTAVELRKMVDTRAGFWVLLSILGVTVAALVTTLATVIFGSADDPTFKDMRARRGAVDLAPAHRRDPAR
jgi:hypothetical protein